MGYTTIFNGGFKITPPLTDEHRKFLTDFSNSRRMKRDAKKLAIKYPGMDIGIEGEWFVSGSDKVIPQDDDILDYNTPPATQPSLWCDWLPNADGTMFVWNESEKTYCTQEWLEYLITYFFEPKGYTLNGEIKAYGELLGDYWGLGIIDNKIEYLKSVLKPI